ncbi:MAG TPA: ABC transporter substrate-binding protein [Tepidisphaeraceae bacterium]|jgi:ABC-type Fe3+-hydroxamate transport system substrate-binding protein|nr:ABC transporter substrate-binding protein [Tepidisphaeraceae bacterium]
MRLLLVTLPLLLLSCNRNIPSPTTRPSVTHPTIASLVPAATDLLVGMGAADHLVAISNYDTPRPETSSLPRVGDYQSLDWERLTTLRPDILITFQAPDRLPAGLKQRADSLHIQLVNIRTETLSDLYAEITHLGQVAGEPAKADAALHSLQSQFDAIHNRVASLPPARTLLLRDETATGAVGIHNFLNDILEIAGGTNAISTPGWPDIDREQLLSLHPDQIILLLSDAPPQVESQARATLQSLPGHPPFTIINQWYAQQPGFHLPDLAKQFAGALHPTPSK